MFGCSKCRELNKGERTDGPRARLILPQQKEEKPHEMIFERCWKALSAGLAVQADRWPLALY